MQLLCGKCGRTTEVDDETTAAAVPCGSCGHEIPVPGRGEDLLGPPGDAFDDGFAGQARQAMVRKIRVVCGSCGRGLKASMRMAGTVIRCPSCERKIRIPFPGETDDRATAEEVSAGSGAPVDATSGTPEARLLPDADDVSVDEAPAGRNLLSDLEQVQAALPGAPPDVAGSVALDRTVAPAPPPARGPHIPTWILLSAVALALVLAGVWVFTNVFSSGTSSNVAGNPAKTATQPDQAKGPGKTEPVRKPPQDIPAPERIGRLKIERTAVDVFAAAGWRAAPPGMFYLQLRVAATAGTEPARFATAGQDVQVLAAGEAYLSLGEPGPFGLPDATAGQLDLAPRQTREFVASFLLPAAALTGARPLQLTVAGLPPVPITGLRVPAPGQLAVGEPYKEVAPRNLQPMLRDPVMRAIQTAGAGELLFRNKAGSLEMSLSASDVSGPVKPAPDGTYTATLRRSGEPQTLTCTLRPVAGGKRVLLYLTNEPFHQLCYVLSGREADLPQVIEKPDADPIPPPTGGPGTFFGKPAPSPRPEPVPEPRPGGGFFDHK